MHIQKITIKNFRNFSDFTISFTEGFQTIVGENNIGKSNLYRAIRIVLDKELSYKDRLLNEKDFHCYKTLQVDDWIMISIDFFGDNLSSFPILHSIKTSDKTARVTYLFAHKSKIEETPEVFPKIEIKDFKYNIYGGGDSLDFVEVIKLNKISLKDLDGVNLFYITAFRNINTDLHGSGKSLLSQYCLSRENSENELKEINKILSASTDQLNTLGFIPEFSKGIKEKSTEIAGKYFSFPISLGFLSDFESDSWNQLNLFFCPVTGKKIPIGILGLGQKNILYLTLFLSKLVNTQGKHDLNVLIIEEPEAHLHPQLQKLLFANLGELKNTQVLMTSHSTHIASDCEFKNLNVLFKATDEVVKSFSPFNSTLLTPREILLLKRYLDATRSEIFFASAVILVEGVAEQFVIPAIAKEVFRINFTEFNVSVIPIHSRNFVPFLKLFKEGSLEIIACAIIDGDSKEIPDGESSTTTVLNAKTFEVANRVKIFVGIDTLEIDLFPDPTTNSSYLKTAFANLGHEISFQNLEKVPAAEWKPELIKRIDGTLKKGRFAQELALLIDKDFIIPSYISDSIKFVAEKRGIAINAK